VRLHSGRRGMRAAEGVRLLKPCQGDLGPRRTWQARSSKP